MTQPDDIEIMVAGRKVLFWGREGIDERLVYLELLQAEKPSVERQRMIRALKERLRRTSGYDN